LGYLLERMLLLVGFGLELSYMIIGLTSFCLYNSMDFLKMQYGILYKVNKTILYKTDKIVLVYRKLIDIQDIL